jgi:hypothetical protein
VHLFSNPAGAIHNGAGAIRQVERTACFSDTNELKEKLIAGLELGAVKRQFVWRQWCTESNDLIASTVSKLFSEIQIIVSQS